ncbi:hypothetical protein [Alkalicoccobacillus murimartini]|uniref:Uncharacterized protein n=1 Tax=Alkalicoccobacillus murimartini TaxID=171685 RepID=A0ABT9YHT0_9BACI|nr:hypothetical protein [Alkalicoccobacillus murimartini]MDQ0207427.1 hypothetical protein [Alkalicoccobacillus murimartini]
MKVKTIELYIGPSIDLDVAVGKDYIEPSIGFDGLIYFLRPLDEEAYNEFILKEHPIQKPCDFEVVILKGEHTEILTVKDQMQPYRYVQPLPNHRFLLVNARSTYDGNGTFVKNAKVLKREGNELKTVREFLMGDGISHVYTTEMGTIWTGYFDEGVFGNMGWGDPDAKEPRDPVGMSGVIKWNLKGEKLFENTQADIADCYAMNVISDHEVWFYYYDVFKLAHLKNGVFKEFDPNFESSNDFIVNDTHVLMRVDHIFQLYEIQGDHLKLVARIHLVNEHEKKMGVANSTIDVRGNRLIFLSRHYLYDVTLDEIVELAKEMLEDE